MWDVFWDLVQVSFWGAIAIHGPQRVKAPACADVFDIFGLSEKDGLYEMWTFMFPLMNIMALPEITHWYNEFAIL